MPVFGTSSEKNTILNEITSRRWFHMDESSKNKDFVQLYRRHIDDLARLARTNGSAYDLFMLLLKNMDGYNALCVSTNALAEIMGVSTRTVFRAAKHLKDNGWICILKSGSTNVYIVNPDIAWTSYGNQKSYCKFATNVILSSTENAEYLKNPKSRTNFKTIDSGFISEVQAGHQKFLAEAAEFNSI